MLSFLRGSSKEVNLSQLAENKESVDAVRFTLGNFQEEHFRTSGTVILAGKEFCVLKYQFSYARFEEAFNTVSLYVY